MTTTKGMKVNKLKGDAFIKLVDKIRQHCINIDGFAVYEDGWSDEKIFEAMKDEFTLTIHNVAGARRMAVGRFKKTAPDIEVKAGSVADLRQRIEALEKWAAARPVEPFRKGDFL